MTKACEQPWQPDKWVGGMVEARGYVGNEVTISWQEFAPVKPIGERYSAALTVYAYLQEAMELAQKYNV